jgi:hypothetical protein
MDAVAGRAPPFGELLDSRVRSAFEGNGIDQIDIHLKREIMSHVPVDICVKVRLGWESSWTTEAGYFHPENSQHCSNITDLNTRLRTTMDALIGGADEARSVEATWANGSTGLLVWDQPSFTVRTMERRWYCHQECGSGHPAAGTGILRAQRQPLPASIERNDYTVRRYVVWNSTSRMSKTRDPEAAGWIIPDHGAMPRHPGRRHPVAGVQREV